MRIFMHNFFYRFHQYSGTDASDSKENHEEMFTKIFYNNFVCVLVIINTQQRGSTVQLFIKIIKA